MTLNVKKTSATSGKPREANLNDEKGDKIESEKNTNNIIKEFGADIIKDMPSPKIENGNTKPDEKTSEGTPKPNPRIKKDNPIIPDKTPNGVVKASETPIKNTVNDITKPGDKSTITCNPTKPNTMSNKTLENGASPDTIMLSLEEAMKKIVEVGDFSLVLQDVLLFLLQKSQNMEKNLVKETETRKIEAEKNNKELQQTLQEENTKLKQIIKKENEERQRDMKDIEGFVKKENADRKKETIDIVDKIKTDEEKRLKESKSLEDKIAREKRELEEYLKKESLEHAQKMELENKAVKEKLDREANELKKKMSEADEEKAEEMKILQTRLENERNVLKEKMEREKAELAEEMEKAEQERKNEAAKLKNKLEEDKKQVESGIVKMFERLKGENETRKTEIHGLKDILVRENERITKEQEALESTIATGLQELDEKLVRELSNCKSDIKKVVVNELTDTMNNDKKEIKNKMESDYSEIKRRIEVETTEIRDKMQFDKKALVLKFEEVEDERQKEAKLIRSQVQREREETRESITSEVKILQSQIEGTATDLMDCIKKEKVDRERAVETAKRRIEEEKQELQQTMDRDRNNMNKKMTEEHDQRRLEQMEVQQRLENTEKSGKTDIQELFNRVKRYEDESRIDNDEVRQSVARTASSLEEKAIRDRKELRDILEHETSDLGRRVDKCNIERLNESADIQAKMCMLGKSASRHLESLKMALHRETQNLIELSSKPGSITFCAYRDDDLTSTEESYITFTGCTVNLGNGFIPKAGMFQCPEPGLYLFTVTVCTFDGKQCLIMLRKNDKNVSTLTDQNENENKGKTMISQTCFLELEISDRVQLFSASGSGISDSKASHFTQFSGVLIRASPDTFKAASKSLAEDENVSVAEGFRGFTPARGFTPTRGFTPSRSRGITPEPILPVVLETPTEKPPHPEFDAIRTLIKSDEGKEDDKPQQSYSAVAKKSAPKAAPGTSKTTPNTPKAAQASQPAQPPPSAPATPKASGGFYSFLKR